MNVAGLLSELSARGIRVSAEGSNLKISAPPNALTAELRGSLIENKAQILALLSSVRASDSGAADEDTTIAKANPEERGPLSAGQLRFFFLDQLNPGTAFLNLPLTLRLRGELDVAALRAAVAEIGVRHDALRTAFGLEEGVPYQVVVPTTLELWEEDFSDVPGREREERALARREIEMRRPFDLSQAPQIRFYLFKLGRLESLFFYVANHIVFDGWSHDVLMRDITHLYEVKLGLAELRPPPAVRYGDYARWMHERRDNAEAKRSMAYWVNHLNGMPATIALPLDYERPAVPAYRGNRHYSKLEGEELSALKQAAMKEGATLSMLALAAMQIVLNVRSGQEGFGIGLPAQGRTRPDVEDVIGMFVNTTVIRASVSVGEQFSDLLARVRHTAAEALEHQHTPFEEIVRALKPVRERNRNPLHQVVFSYQDARGRAYKMSDLLVDQIPSFTGASGTEVTFWVRDHGTWAIFQVETDSELFSAQTGEGLLSCWLAVMNAAATQKDLSVEAALRIAGSYATERFASKVPALPEDAPLSERPVAVGGASAEIEAEVTEIWRASLMLTEIQPTDDFFALGGHSLLALRILNDINNRFGVRVPLGIFFEHRTLRGLAQYVEQLMAKDTSEGEAGTSFSPVVRIKPQGKFPPLFCIAGMGGNPMELHVLADAMGPDQPFLGLQYRGVEGQYEPRRRMEEIADDFVKGIRLAQPKGPYYLAGFSFGGLAAYEAARQLTREGDQVATVILLDTSPIHVRARVMYHISKVRAEGLGYIRDRINARRKWRADEKEKWARLENEPVLTKANAIVFEANREAGLQYMPGRYSGDVTVIRAVPPGGYKSSYRPDDTLGWDRLVDGQLTVTRVTANHRGLVAPEHASQTAKAILDALAYARIRHA